MNKNNGCSKLLLIFIACLSVKSQISYNISSCRKHIQILFRVFRLSHLLKWRISSSIMPIPKHDVRLNIKVYNLLVSCGITQDSLFGYMFKYIALRDQVSVKSFRQSWWPSRTTSGRFCYVFGIICSCCYTLHFFSAVSTKP